MAKILKCSDFKIKVRNEVCFLQGELRHEDISTDARFEEEKQLWIKCTEGDESARDELILAYRPMVYWLAKKLKVPYSTYPDLIQEGIVALIGAVDAFDISRNNRFSTFAYYKIRGRMINFLQRVEAKAPIAVDEEFFAEEDMSISSVMDQAERSEWTLDLEQALSRLSERESDIVRALVIEGRMAREVADEINIDISHVYRIRRKALGKLRKWLGINADDATSAM